MAKPRILVTGAAGKTGTPTVLQLLEKGFPVRALVRKRDDRSGALERAGAEIAVGSLEDPVELEIAMRGVQRAYFCPPLEPGTLRRAALFAVAAQEARLEVAVVLSQWLVDRTHLALHAREKYLSERVFAWMPDVKTITIVPGWFADNYMAAFEAISQFGLMALPFGQGLNAPPSNEDIAGVIAGALTRPDGLIGKSLRPTGPKLLSPDDIASTFGRVLGCAVRYQDAPMSLFLKFAKSIGISDFLVTQLHAFLLDYQRNSFGVGAPTDAVREVGGRDPEPFETIVRRYAAASSLSRRTVASMTRAVWNLTRAMMTSAPDVAALTGQLGHPTIINGTLAADSAAWRNTHGWSAQAQANHRRFK
jgi:NAD(P)H dehydrogenase (quinone)